jgi:cell division septum initiation protein DivIVA
MDEMEYSTVKYTISKLIDKLTWAEHTAGTLQAENERLREEVSRLEEELKNMERAIAGQLDLVSYWRKETEAAEKERDELLASLPETLEEE